MDVAELNAVAKELNNTMSDESKLAYLDMQVEQMREHMRIASEEFLSGLDSQKSEPHVVNQPTVAPSIKK